MSKRKGAWRFSAVWTFPRHMVAATSTDPIIIQNELQQIENEMKRLLLQTERFPLYLRNIELKYKLSDWELARTKIPLQLPVQGYIQAQNNYSIDAHNLNLWFSANWSPVENAPWPPSRWWTLASAPSAPARAPSRQRTVASAPSAPVLESGSGNSPRAIICSCSIVK